MKVKVKGGNKEKIKHTAAGRRVGRRTSVENQDPSGASGGLFYLIFSICITFLDQYYRLIMAIFKKYIVLFAEIQIGKE